MQDFNLLKFFVFYHLSKKEPYLVVEKTENVGGMIVEKIEYVLVMKYRDPGLGRARMGF